MTTSSPFPQWLVLTLESQYPVLDIHSVNYDTPTLILVLGGGHSNSPGLPPTDQLASSALARLVEAVRLKRLIPHSKIVSSGFSASGGPSQAEMVAKAALELGVDGGDTLMIKSPQNTCQEVTHFIKRFHTNQQVILVTDAIHMPRAMKQFETHGLKPLSAPTNHFIKTDSLRSYYNFKPSYSKIEMMQCALHEYVGLLSIRP